MEGSFRGLGVRSCCTVQVEMEPDANVYVRLGTDGESHVTFMKIPNTETGQHPIRGNRDYYLSEKRNISFRETLPRDPRFLLRRLLLSV